MPASGVTVSEAHVYLEPVADRLRQEGFRVQIDVREDDALQAIRETARRRRADLIVLSTHGYPGRRSALRRRWQ